MEPVTLIVTALAAGAASALPDGAKSTVKTAYARLRELAKKRFAGRSSAEFVLAQHEQAPDIYRKPLEHELLESGAAGDCDLVAAAQELMKLLDAKGCQEGKYAVSVLNSQGVQVGDGNTQTNYFGAQIRAGRDAYHSDRDMTIHRGDGA